MRCLDFRKLSYGIAKKYTAYRNGSHNDRYINYYKFQILINSGFQLLLCLIPTIVVGRLTGMLLSIATLFTLKKSAGGSHADSYAICTIITVAVLYFCTYCGIYINYILGLFMFLISLVLILKYAPKDHANLPITDPELREAQKYASIFFWLLWLVISLCLSKYCGTISLTVLIVSLNLIKIKNSAATECCTNI